MMRAYYDYRRDLDKRGIRYMADELSEFNIPYKLTADSLEVGDRTLMKYEDRYLCWGDSLYSSYNNALRWLIADNPDLGVSNLGNIVIKHTNFSPIYERLESKVSFNPRAWTFPCFHDDQNRILTRRIPAIKRIELNCKKGNIYTTVIWGDGSKPTVVKKSEDDPYDLYFAVASAIAIKAYGSNSAFKREIEEKLEDITGGIRSWIENNRIEHNSTSKYNPIYKGE